MTLLDWLYHYRHQLGIDLVLAHVNHHQRIEADQEERGIRALAEAKTSTTEGCPFLWSFF